MDYREVTKNGEEILHSKSGVYTTYDFTDKAIEKIGDFEFDGGNFLIVSYNAPHYPYVLPESYLDAYKDDLTMPNLRRNYLNTVFEMDRNIGKIYDKLVNDNLWENTVFIFASDNGATNEGGSNYPLRGIKGELFDGANKVPGFIASPLFEKSGTKSKKFDGIAHFTDLMVTIQVGDRYCANKKLEDFFQKTLNFPNFQKIYIKYIENFCVFAKL